MALTLYQQQTQRLLYDPVQSEYSLSDLTVYINIARTQIAASTQCLRYTASLATVSGTQTYALSTFTGAPSGVAGALNVRMAARQVNVGPPVTRSFLELRNWEWFFAYYYSAINTAANAAPTIWSVQEPGPLGSVALYPTPDAAYTISFDAVGYPIPLVDDTTAEALPLPWTDSIPYFAAYLAYLNSQRDRDAAQMFQLWQQFASWGTKQTTPTVLPSFYPGGRGAQEASQKIGNTGIGLPPQPMPRGTGGGGA